MQGLLFNNAIIDGTEKGWIAKESIRQAEETLKQLEEKHNERTYCTRTNKLPTPCYPAEHPLLARAVSNH